MAATLVQHIVHFGARPHTLDAHKSVVKQFLLLCPAAATINYPPLCIFAGLTLPDHCIVRVSQHNNYVGKSAHVDSFPTAASSGGGESTINEFNRNFYLLDRLEVLRTTVESRRGGGGTAESKVNTVVGVTLTALNFAKGVKMLRP